MVETARLDLKMVQHSKNSSFLGLENRHSGLGDGDLRNHLNKNAEDAGGLRWMKVELGGDRWTKVDTGAGECRCRQVELVNAGKFR